LLWGVGLAIIWFQKGPDKVARGEKRYYKEHRRGEKKGT